MITHVLEGRRLTCSILAVTAALTVAPPSLHAQEPSWKFKLITSAVVGGAIGGVMALMNRGAEKGPFLSVPNTRVGFGTVPVGATLDKSFEVTNEGRTPLQVVAVEVVGDASFVCSTTPLPAAVSPQSRISVSCRFTPSTANPVASQVRIRAADGGTGRGKSWLVGLSGEGR